MSITRLSNLSVTRLPCGCQFDMFDNPVSYFIGCDAGHINFDDDGPPDDASADDAGDNNANGQVRP